MRYIAIVSLAGLAMIAAGPMALQAVGAPKPDGAKRLDARSAVEAPVAAERAARPAIAPLSVAMAPESAIAAEQPLLLGGMSPEAAASDAPAGGPEEQAMEGEGDQSPAETLASRIRVSLFADNRCPGEQQSLVIIGAATRGWDVDTTGSALRIVGNDTDLCPAVGAAVRATRDLANQAARQNAAPNGRSGGGNPPGGGGGPGYQSQG